MGATHHMRLLSTGNAASATKPPNFEFYLILIDLNLSSPVWLGTALRDDHKDIWDAGEHG